MEESIRSGDAQPAARRKNMMFGLLLVVGGILLFVNQLTVFHVGHLWPLVLVGFGVVKIAGACCARQRRGGAWMIGVGLWFVVNEFTRLHYHDTWPLLLLLAGALIMWDAVSPTERCESCREGHHGR